MKKIMYKLFGLIVLCGLPPFVYGSDQYQKNIFFEVDSIPSSPAVTIILAMTLIALIPGLLIVMTSFTRTIIVLSMLRHAMGMQENPPNIVLIMLAAFMTLLSMSTTFERLENEVATPLFEQRISNSDALKITNVVMKEYMISHTNEQDIAFVFSLSDKVIPESIEALSLTHLVPAFLLSELRLAFQIGFIIFLPFLLVDIIVSSILMSMGMMMVPPISIALPIKIMMFILIDGWTLVTKAILTTGLY